MQVDSKSQNNHPRLRPSGKKVATLLPPKGPHECRFESFSQTVLAMLLRLVGTAVTAGVCEKVIELSVYVCLCVWGMCCVGWSYFC